MEHNLLDIWPNCLGGIYAVRNIIYGTFPDEAHMSSTLNKLGHYYIKNRLTLGLLSNIENTEGGLILINKKIQ